MKAIHNQTGFLFFQFGPVVTMSKILKMKAIHNDMYFDNTQMALL